MNFPSDRLSCEFELGAWTYPGSYENIFPMGTAADAAGVGYDLAELWEGNPATKCDRARSPA